MLLLWIVAVSVAVSPSSILASYRSLAASSSGLCSARSHTLASAVAIEERQEQEAALHHHGTGRLAWGWAVAAAGRRSASSARTCSSARWRHGTSGTAAYRLHSARASV